MRFVSDDGTVITKTVTIDINESSASTDYNLTNATTPIDVNYSNETKEIKVQLIKSDGTPVSGATIVAKSIPAAYGYIASATSYNFV